MVSKRHLQLLQQPTAAALEEQSQSAQQTQLFEVLLWCSPAACLNLLSMLGAAVSACCLSL